MTTSGAVSQILYHTYYLAVFPMASKIIEENSLLGHDYYMSPQHCMQEDLARSSDLNLKLYVENFIKDKVSEILLLWNILTGANSCKR